MSLEVGQMAPDFSLFVDEQYKISLKDYRGKKLILYFYPKDDTPGCTLESCGFRDIYEELQNLGADVLGVSQDSIKSHHKFKKKYALPFHLGADEEGIVCTLYNVIQSKNNFGRSYKGIERSTFLIDEEGKVVRKWLQVNVAGHLKEVLESIKG